MKIHRIYAIVLRNVYAFRHSLDRLSDAFYWPTIDLLLWGLTSAYFTTIVASKSNFITMIVAGILLWLVVWRAQYEITVGILTELWDRNLINIFISPLKFPEWVISFITLGIMKGLLSFCFASGVAFLLYKVQIFTIGISLLPFLFLLFMTGWWVGFFVAGLIIRYGTKIQMLAWSFVAIFSPFSAIYYPVSILPKWAQEVAIFVPTSYVFEAARAVIKNQPFDPRTLLLAFLINCVYVCLAIWFLQRSFKKIQQKGLVNLD